MNKCQKEVALERTLRGLGRVFILGSVERYMLKSKSLLGNNEFPIFILEHNRKFIANACRKDTLSKIK
jgi:hypothetical protein